MRRPGCRRATSREHGMSARVEAGGVVVQAEGRGQGVEEPGGARSPGLRDHAGWLS